MVKPEALIILISIGGGGWGVGVGVWGCGWGCVDSTMWIYVHFSCFVFPKLTFIINRGIGKSKGWYIFLIFENKFEHVTSHTQFWLAQIIMLYKFVTGLNHHTDVLLLFQMMGSNMKK